jgi:MYXO-CTERM domain-containing protein
MMGPPPPRPIRRVFRRILAGAAAVTVAGAARVSPAAASPADMQLQIAAHPAIKLAVQGDGWSRVSGGQLHAAGLAVDADVNALQLFADGVEQPIRMIGNGDATLDDGEALEFYGIGRDTLWTDTRTYWLVVGTTGARVPYIVNQRGAAAPASFSFTETLREHKTYYAPLLNGDASNFFGAAVDDTGATQTLTLNHVADPTTAVMQLTLQGVSAGNHVVAVSLGGQMLGTCTLSGQESATCPFSLPAIAEGANMIGLVAQGDAPDISFVASIAITYDHAYVADGDRLKLTAPPGTRVTVTGFPSDDVRVVDVTEPDAPVELVVGLSAAGATWTAGFDVAAGPGPRTLWAFTDASVGAPSAIAANRPSTWTTSGSGELLILSNALFVDAVRPLANRRAAEGWSVELVDLQDVYDELGAGDKTAFAIRDFVEAAVAHWAIPPRDVLLVGDATFDPRNFTGLGDFDFAPTKLVDTAQVETSSDDWFVDTDEDGLPNLGIGRLPVRTAAQATTVVQKILSYAGKTELPRGALFVTDQNDTDLNFEQASANSATAVSDLTSIDTFMRSDPTATKAGLLAKLGAGPFLVNYFGHGSVEVWDDLFSITDAAALTNQHSSIYVSMNCLNGFFHDLYTTSLAEALLEAPSGGAVAVWASSTLTAFEPQMTLNREFLSRIGRTSLGEADMAAKRAITDVDARRTWMIFGDPTLFGSPSSFGDAGTPDGGTASVDSAPSSTSGDATLDSMADASDASASRDAPADVRGETPSADHSPTDVSTDSAKPAGSAGCSCSVADRSPASGGFTLAGLALLHVVRRRRRRGEAAGRRAYSSRRQPVTISSP